MRRERLKRGLWLSFTRSGRGGFTLLELLLAVAISAFVITVSYQFFGVIERSGKFAAQNNSLQSQVPPLFYLFLKDFESANQAYGGFVVHRGVDGELKSLEFFTENCNYFGGICRVKYYLLETPSGRKVLMREEGRINSLAPRGIEVPVSFKVNSFEVYRTSGSEWVKVEEGKRRLSLIKVVVGIEGGGELPLVYKVRS